MKIRYGEEKDFEKAKGIWLECFTDSQEEVDFYFKNLYNRDNYLILEENNEILASLHENKFCLNLGKGEISSYYIVGVAVSPEYRRRGYMREIIKTSILGAKNKGYDFIYLCPINSKLYRKFGFDYMVDIEKYKFDIREIPDTGSDKKILIKKLQLHLIDEYICDLMNIYSEGMKDFSVYVKRDKKTFENLLKEVFSDGGEVYIFYKNNQPAGYIIFYKSDKITVREIFSKDKSILMSILSFVKTFKEYYTEVEVSTPIGTNFNFYFENQEQIEKNVTPFIMGRVINPIQICKKVMKSFVDFNLKIDDSVIIENDGVYRFFQNGEITFSKDGNWDIRIDIGTLGQLLLGYFTIAELVSMEKIIVKDEEILKKLKNMEVFPAAKNYIYDYQ